MTAFLRPRALTEALQWRHDHPDFELLAGGTDLMVAQRGQPHPPGVIDLFGLPELGSIEEAGDHVRVGAGATYATIRESVPVQTHLPLLAAAAREVGARQIQVRGTLGGNLATSSPVGDTLPVLLALDAEVELASVRGVRTVPYDGFCVGYRQIDLQADELIVAVRFPQSGFTREQYWRKVGSRRAQAISKVMLAASARRDPDSRCHDVRFALGAVADRPIRARAAEALVEGQIPDGALADACAKAVRDGITPIDDVRSTAWYRSAVAGNLVARFVRRLAGE